MDKQILLDKIYEYINDVEDLMHKSAGEAVSNILMIIGSMED